MPFPIQMFGCLILLLDLRLTTQQQAVFWPPLRSDLPLLDASNASEEEVGNIILPGIFERMTISISAQRLRNATYEKKTRLADTVAAVQARPGPFKMSSTVKGLERAANPPLFACMLQLLRPGAFFTHGRAPFKSWDFYPRVHFSFPRCTPYSLDYFIDSSYRQACCVGDDSRHKKFLHHTHFNKQERKHPHHKPCAGAHGPRGYRSVMYNQYRNPPQSAYLGQLSV